MGASRRLRFVKTSPLEIQAERLSIHRPEPAGLCYFLPCHRALSEGPKLDLTYSGLSLYDFAKSQRYVEDSLGLEAWPLIPHILVVNIKPGTLDRPAR